MVRWSRYINYEIMMSDHENSMKFYSLDKYLAQLMVLFNYRILG